MLHFRSFAFIFRFPMLTKFLQCLILIAVANPFCCCTAGFLAGTTEPVAEHSCCTTKGEYPGAQSSQDTKQKECPHQTMKSHQQVTQQDIKAPEACASYVPVLIAVLDIFEVVGESYFIAQTIYKTQLASSGAPPSLSQLYCVYRI